MKSVIEVKKVGNVYEVDARGKWGGGWTSKVIEGQLYNAILRGWQMYGGNPEGIEIRGDLPEDVKRMTDKLKPGAGKDVFTLRLSSAEAGLVKEMAEAEGMSINQYIRQKIFA